jgi:MFS family permease
LSKERESEPSAAVPVSIEPASTSMAAPFRVRSFRFQWPADLVVSWAFEMETIILGWYVLVETGSVLLLTLFGALQFGGTLLSPLLGVAGDRVGHKRVLMVMRTIYAVLAATLMGLAFSGLLQPWIVLTIAAVAGLVRPSDLAMRSSIVAESMPASLLTAAMGVSRTTMDSARIAGALVGAGLLATLGMGPAYAVITTFYLVGLLLTAGIVVQARAAAAAGEGAVAPRPSPWQDLVAGIRYVWTTPRLLAAMWLAFLVNLTAFPLTSGLLPYVAREIYRTDQTGLGYLVAGFASGALVGSLVLGKIGGRVRLGRLMIGATCIWYLGIMVFAQMNTLRAGLPVMLAIGFMQSLGMVSLAVILLRTSEPALRGRVMGVRMLAIYSLPIGLMTAGWSIERIGYPATATLYAATGLFLTLTIGIAWRRHLLARNAPANAR